MMWNGTEQKMEEVKPAEPEKGDSDAEGGDEGDKPDEENDEQQPPSAVDDGSPKDGDEDDQEEVEKEIEEPPPKEFKVVPFTEAMFAERMNKPEFDEIRRIEDEVLEFKKENLKVYVVAAGVPYGNGETVFN